MHDAGESNIFLKYDFPSRLSVAKLFTVVNIFGSQESRLKISYNLFSIRKLYLKTFLFENEK
jgi:hypothetical protein